MLFFLACLPYHLYYNIYTYVKTGFCRDVGIQPGRVYPNSSVPIKMCSDCETCS